MVGVEPRGQQVWMLRIECDIWSCDLAFRGDALGWEVRTLREGKLFVSRRFPGKVQATDWAAEMRSLLQCFSAVGDVSDGVVPMGHA